MNFIDKLFSSFTPEDDVKFILFTRQNQSKGQVLKFDDVQSVLDSSFNKSHPVRFTIHGWNDDKGAKVNTSVKRAYFEHGDYNMITVDWSKGANVINYWTACKNAKNAGRFTAKFIDFLHQNKFVLFENIHIIGHSLGAHAAGFVGDSVKRGTIQMIQGLDPAGVSFNLENPNDRLSSSDAVYVEIIHTNGAQQGLYEPIGHADFYPNYGKVQPGCGELFGGDSHQRAADLYAESINNIFTARECSFSEMKNERLNSKGRSVRMGGPLGNVGLTGIYFLQTNACSPYSKG